MADIDDCPFADRISAGLHLGDLRAMTALAQAEAEEQAEWCVVTVLSERDLAGLALPRHVDHHLIIRADDDLAVDLTPEFARAHAVIASALARDKSVLVHCMAGISRSATIVAAYLILDRGIDAAAALAVLRQHRRCIGPNAAFRQQLKALAEANAARPCRGKDQP
ncbi:Protein tyrosine phosphatase incomplete domain containing protein [Pandoravirus quercus]|uniref:Protein tyrosine phosphatase incomplete domain containing protein n=1 Tax=Pandoravirus quercus TaxID=2107709 RepID=A0A2U7U9A2_9VIRU|nr:Protein tyrosine phosphatase incomplete domain containing protein [Pandoravirus quercus]AVK74965.1 Protein tyrosine phosphatase incomplete domain containing protein [Pandoravirus quercus]